MRVVLASTVTGRGGVWRHITDVADGMQARGCEVDLALPADALALRREAATRGLTVRDLGASARGEVFHVHLADTYDNVAFRAIVRARRRGSRIVVTEHLPRSDASDPTARPETSAATRGAYTAKTTFKRVQYALCDRIICVSESSRQFVLSRYGVSPDAVVAIPNGIGSANPFIRLPDGPAHFVAIGSVIAQKGFDVLIEAAGSARSSWSVDVIGEGAHLAQWSALSEELAVPIRFVGGLDDVSSALDAASALVVPSRWEAWPYVALEAMQHGRAIVASNVDGLPEIVADGTTGILVPPDDPVALAHALDRLADDGSTAEAMGRAGRDRVPSFAIDTMLSRLFDEYRSTRRGRRVGATDGHSS